MIRYTFFEVAMQKGHLMSVFSELLPRHWVRGCSNTADGQDFIFEARRQSYETEPALTHVFTGRQARESQQMWMERARREAIDVWEAFCKTEAARVAALKAEYQNTRAQSDAAVAAAAKAEQDRIDSERAAVLLGSTAAAMNLNTAPTPAPEVVAPKKARAKRVKKG